MNSLINAIWSQYLKVHQGQIENFIEKPHETQTAQLKTILKTARNTEWGLRYQFDSITKKEEWQQRVPIREYDLFKNDINRMMQGETDILWPGRVKYFAKSSGTTADKSKFNTHH
jgi:hypothetical protein